MGNNKKILVTGGAGYIGSILVPDLLNHGYKVTVLDNFSFGQQSLLGVCNSPNLEVIKGDVRDKPLFKNLIEENKIIIPLAAIVGAPACKKDEVLATQINFEQIYDLSQWISASHKVIFPVTNSGYGIGTKDKFCDEESPLNPISLYGKTKVKAEKIILEKGNAVTLRLATVFGASPRMRMDLLVNDFVYKACSDRSIVLFESHFKRNFIHIRDVSNAFIHSLNNFDIMKGQAYNVGLSNANLSKMELCHAIQKEIPDFHVFESELGQDPDKRDYIVSNEKIEATGWKPDYTINHGIRELVKVYSFLKVNPHNNL
mgnify:CR=1 FL=1